MIVESSNTTDQATKPIDIDKKEITQDELKRLDRQRFIGLETQKRLLNSLVLITPLNGPNAQLAKNLVLSGVTIAVYDPHTITQLDFETNFLVAHDVIGKNRGQTLLNRLREMNASANHKLITQDITQKDPEYFKNFTLICTSTTSFSQIKKWDSICRQINKPYFNSIGNGLSCFAYISLGKSYNYVTKNQKTRNIVYGKDGKPTNPFILYDEVTMDSLPFEQTLKCQNIKKQIYYSILMMKQAEDKGLKYDAFNPDEAILQQILEPIKKGRPQTTWNYHTNFAKTFGIDFCPVYSVLGSVLSQQFIKIISQKDLPVVNWFYYDSEASIGQTIELPSQNKDRQIRKDRPDLKEPVAARNK